MNKLDTKKHVRDEILEFAKPFMFENMDKFNKDGKELCEKILDYCSDNCEKNLPKFYTLLDMFVVELQFSKDRAFEMIHKVRLKPDEGMN